METIGTAYGGARHAATFDELFEQTASDGPSPINPVTTLYPLCDIVSE